MATSDAIPNPRGNAAQGSSRKRSRFVKILATVLILFTAALAAIWWSMRLPAKDLQEIAHVKKLGGVVGRPYKLPTAVLKIIPRDLRLYTPMGEAISVGFFGPQPTDDDLIGTFNHFQDLQQIQLSRTLVTDRIVEGISKQRRLQMLWLCWTPITDEGMSQLSRNRTMTHLFLDGTKITDKGVEGISTMTQIQTLSLANTEVTDSSVDFLLKMPSLRILDIEGTKISEEGRARLKQKERLTFQPGLSTL